MEKQVLIIIKHNVTHPILPATTNQTAINQLNPLHSTLHPQFPSQAGEIKVIWDFKF